MCDDEFEPGLEKEIYRAEQIELLRKLVLEFCKQQSGEHGLPTYVQVTERQPESLSDEERLVVLAAKMASDDSEIDPLPESADISRQFVDAETYARWEAQARGMCQDKKLPTGELNEKLDEMTEQMIGKPPSEVVSTAALSVWREWQQDWRRFDSPEVIRRAKQFLKLKHSEQGDGAPLARSLGDVEDAVKIEAAIAAYDDMILRQVFPGTHSLLPHEVKLVDRDIKLFEHLVLHSGEAVSYETLTKVVYPERQSVADGEQLTTRRSHLNNFLKAQRSGWRAAKVREKNELILQRILSSPG